MCSSNIIFLVALKWGGRAFSRRPLGTFIMCITQTCSIINIIMFNYFFVKEFYLGDSGYSNNDFVQLYIMGHNIICSHDT